MQGSVVAFPGVKMELWQITNHEHVAISNKTRYLTMFKSKGMQRWKTGDNFLGSRLAV